MITILNERWNGGPCDPITQKRTPEDALRSLVEFELGFGASLKKLEQDRIVVVTRAFAATDTVTFTGSVEEMYKLVKVTAIHFKMWNECRDELIDLALKPFGGSASALEATHFVPMLMGGMTAHTSLCVAYNLPEDELKTAAKLKIGDLIAALELREQTGMKLADIV